MDPISVEEAIEQPSPAPVMSKSKLKKLRRDEKWEAGREARKEQRKVKLRAKKERKRAERETQAAQAVQKETQVVGQDIGQTKSHPRRGTQLPVTFIIDCAYDDLMHDPERKSLTSQITRCYSDNQKASFRAHLMISSFNGLLKDRFDGVLHGNHKLWRGVQFCEENVVDAVGQARARMVSEKGGRLAGAFSDTTPIDSNREEMSRDGELVYLTSDSTETLTELKPYSIYIIGGLVDKNRHKGVCKKAANELGTRTAKLPIGDYMQMNSRFVLTVNHVNEILLRWLQVKDWAKAFLDVMPKRKGGELKDLGDERENALSRELERDQHGIDLYTEPGSHDKTAPKPEDTHLEDDSVEVDEQQRSP